MRRSSSSNSAIFNNMCLIGQITRDLTLFSTGKWTPQLSNSKVPIYPRLLFWRGGCVLRCVAEARGCSLTWHRLSARFTRRCCVSSLHANLSSPCVNFRSLNAIHRIPSSFFPLPTLCHVVFQHRQFSRCYSDASLSNHQTLCVRKIARSTAPATLYGAIVRPILVGDDDSMPCTPNRTGNTPILCVIGYD